MELQSQVVQRHSNLQDRILEIEEKAPKTSSRRTSIRRLDKLERVMSSPCLQEWLIGFITMVIPLLFLCNFLTLAMLPTSLIRISG
jgi:hypothetical protein